MRKGEMAFIPCCNKPCQECWCEEKDAALSPRYRRITGKGSPDYKVRYEENTLDTDYCVNESATHCVNQTVLILLTAS